MVALCGCGKEKTIQVASILRVVRRTGVYRCLSCSTTSLYEDPEFREKNSSAIKKSWTDERKKKQSVISKNMWSNPHMSEYLRQASINAWSDPDRRHIASEQAKLLWTDLDFRSKYELMWSDPIYRRANAERIRAVWQRPEYRSQFDSIFASDEYRLKLSECAKFLWSDNEYREKAIRAQQEVWNRPEHRQKMAEVRARISNSGEDSGIERVTQHILTSLGVPWIRHHIIGHYEFDLFVPDHNLLVECQGEYWHSLDMSKRINSAKYTYIDEYFPEKTILYLYERDFLNPEIIKRKLRTQLFHDLVDPDPIEFSFDGIKIQKLDVKDKQKHSFRSAPEEFLQSYHYAAYGRSAKTVYGAFLGDLLIAVCKFSSVIREEVATSMGVPSLQVLELDRFCIHPNYQKKNFGSWMVSRCCGLAFDEFPLVRVLVAFADATYDHVGTIYKASNWQEIHKVRPDYYYISNDGFVMHKKTLYGHARSMKKTEREYAEEHGYKKFFGKEKTKFIFNRP